MLAIDRRPVVHRAPDSQFREVRRQQEPKGVSLRPQLVYGASTSETGSILCNKFNVFYRFVWKNEIIFVPLLRQERTRWFTPPAVSGTAAWQSSVDIPNIRSISDSLQKEK